MNKIAIFDLYRDVLNIIEDAFVENPDLENDEKYIIRINTITHAIVMVENPVQLPIIYNWVCVFRDECFRHSVGHMIFNSIADAILECIDEA